MIKRQEDAGQWYWFEVYDGDVLSDTVAWDVCEDCHGDGTDNVLTPWPLQSGSSVERRPAATRSKVDPTPRSHALAPAV